MLRMFRNNKGATAIEYGPIAALSKLGTKLGNTFNNVSGKLVA